MKLKYFLLILPILFWLGCEDKDDSPPVDCTALTLASTDAGLEWATALGGDPTGDHSALCAANVAAYQAGLDGSCSGFDQAGLDVIQAACDDATDAMALKAMSDFIEAMLSGNMDSTSAIHDQFGVILGSDPSNLTANFGVAFTTLASIGQSESLESTMNSWGDCLESLGMTDPLGRTIINDNETAFGIPTSLNEIASFNAAHFLSYLPIIKPHEFILMRTNTDCPEIGSLQDLLEDMFLSQITGAIDHLSKVVGKGFVFTITPEMMGDDEQSPINLDDTEIYLMKGVLHQLRALIYNVITYNVDIPYYDLMEEPDSSYSFPWLAQDASFLTIREGQEQSLPNAHADLNNVFTSLQSAVTFLQSDTDAENDLIQPDEGELTEILEAISEAQNILSGPYLIEDITINIYQFLNNPPTNLKNILPGYTITAGPRLTWDVTTCVDWMAGWDVTIGGLFPDFTTEMIFEDLSDDECSNILEGFSFGDDDNECFCDDGFGGSIDSAENEEDCLEAGGYWECGGGGDE